MEKVKGHRKIKLYTETKIEYRSRKEEEMKERITICRLSSKGRVRERETKERCAKSRFYFAAI